MIETNYGSVFDVRSVPQPENLAYSDLGLGLHTDNPYREPVPGFQALHAWSLRRTAARVCSPTASRSPSTCARPIPMPSRCSRRLPVPFQYRSKDAELYAERPLIQLSCSGEVTAVHYNSRSIAPLRLASREVAAFYAAYRRFAGAAARAAVSDANPARRR